VITPILRDKSEAYFANIDNSSANRTYYTSQNTANRQ
jgi:hypothetical protein